MMLLPKLIKFCAMALAIFLAVSIIGGILSAAGLFTGLFGGKAVTEDVTTYAVPSNIQSLEININAADLTIKRGESFSVESNLKHLSVEHQDGALTIKETKKLSVSYSDAVLTLYIPDDAVFQWANITTGAGKLTVARLAADRMDLKLGAGAVHMDCLIAASDIDIEGGAGQITIADGALHNLDLDMGVGQLKLTSMLTGESDFKLGVGESNITVLGDQSDYTLDIEKGIGSITLDGTSVSNVDKEGNGSHSIDISGGIGAIHLQFENP